MKGSTAQGILKELEQTELRVFLASLEPRTNGAILRDISILLLSISEVNEREVSQTLGLAKGQYYKRINELGNLLLAFDPDGFGHREGERAYRMALRLLMGGSFEAAIEVLELGLEFAATYEEFDLEVRLAELSAMLPAGMQVPDLQATSYLELRENLNQYQRLSMEVEALGKLPDASLKRTTALAFLQRETLQDPTSALSRKARFYFLKSRSACNGHLRNYSAAIEDVEEAVELLKAHRQLFPNFEYLISREYTVLQLLLQASKQPDRGANARKAVEALRLTSKRARIELEYSNFPTAFAIAIDRGDFGMAVQAVSEFQHFVQDTGPSVQGSYFTTNLYWCLSIGLLTREEAIWIWAFRSISAYSKTEFRPRYYPLYRFLEVIRAIDILEWEEAIRLSKNLRISSTTEEVTGLREVLNILSRVITRWQASSSKAQPTLTPSERESLEEVLSGSDLPDFFDLLRWFESREAGRPVLS